MIIIREIYAEIIINLCGKFNFFPSYIDYPWSGVVDDYELNSHPVFNSLIVSNSSYMEVVVVLGVTLSKYQVPFCQSLVLGQFSLVK